METNLMLLNIHLIFFYLANMGELEICYSELGEGASKCRLMSDKYRNYWAPPNKSPYDRPLCNLINYRFFAVNTRIARAPFNNFTLIYFLSLQEMSALLRAQLKYHLFIIINKILKSDGVSLKVQDQYPSRWKLAFT